MRCVLVTGLSGAGRSTALRQLEDMGYFCVDNLPPQMMATFISMCQCENIEKVALVVDSRTRMFFADIYKAMDDLKNMGVQMEILYLETADEVLIRRYKETRRKHPMGTNTIMQGIAVERQRLGELRNMAQHIIDTSTMSAKQLSEMLWGLFSDEHKRDTILPVIVSFGFKNGIPLDADLVFDVRFLPNPFYDPALRPMSGLDAPVRNYVYDHEQTRLFEDKLVDLLEMLLPYYQQEGKYQLVVAIGCTGGQHRSVAVAESLYRRLTNDKIQCVVQHRDIGKDALKH